MSNSVEQQFSELNLSQEDHDQYEQEDHQDQRLVPTLVYSSVTKYKNT